MQKFTRESNGYTLTIEVDKTGLLAEIDEDIKRMEDLKKEIAKKGESVVAAEQGDNPDEYMEGSEYMADYKYEYDMQSVYGDPESDWCTPDEIIQDREDFKNIVNRLATGDGEELWNMIQFKKNGTFKKNSKPMIKEAINGSYWEDSYGWNTLVLRLVPVTDTLARVELDTIVLHY